MADDVDVRTDGGYIVAAPSVVQGGGAYRWVPGLELDVPRDGLSEPPGWLIEELDGTANGSAAVSHGSERHRHGSNPRRPTQWNARRLAGGMRRNGMTQDEILAALMQVNQDRCVPPLAAREVQQIAASVARYEPDQVTVALVEDHYGQMVGTPEPAPLEFPDPGPLPESLLRVPGFVGEVMDFTLGTAPYPNPVLAFAGALTLQAFLSGRKVRDPADIRTNIYLLGLAHSASARIIRGKSTIASCIESAWPSSLAIASHPVKESRRMLFPRHAFPNGRDRWHVAIDQQSEGRTPRKHRGPLLSKCTPSPAAYIPCVARLADRMPA